MIEIALDNNNNDLFKDKPCPLYRISEFSAHDFTDYQRLAERIITAYPEAGIIIIRNLSDNCSINLLAVAMFVEACRLQTKLECAVFKTNNYLEAMEEYKPYIALTIGIRLALRLCKETADAIYREIQNMGYLGLAVTTDYINSKINVALSGTGSKAVLKAENTAEAIAVASTLKALSLARANADVTAEIAVNNSACEINEQKIILQIIKNVNPWIKTL